MKIGFYIYFKISSVLNKVLWKKTKIFLSQLKKILTTEKYIGYAHSSEPEKVIFYITNPVNGKPATKGNGSQVTLMADSKEAVEKFYEIAISKGATNEGPPGVRKDGNYYGYIRDLDGNKIAAKSVLK